MLAADDDDVAPTVTPSTVDATKENDAGRQRLRGICISEYLHMHVEVYMWPFATTATTAGAMHLDGECVCVCQ